MMALLHSSLEKNTSLMMAIQIRKTAERENRRWVCFKKCIEMSLESYRLFSVVYELAHSKTTYNHILEKINDKARARIIGR